MICPKCEYEYINGITVCPDCGTKLVPIEEYNGKLAHSSSWVIVYTTDALYEAEGFKANLEGAGIQTTILGQKDGSFPAVGNLAVIKILVKKSDQKSAIEIINDINRRTTQKKSDKE
jgi:hypothetical protein